MAVEPFRSIASQYNRMNDILSVGFHRLWKRKLVKTVFQHLSVQDGIFLDIASGTGQVANRLIRRAGCHPMVVALDPCKEMLKRGSQLLGNEITWIQAQSEALPFGHETVKAITCAFGVRNFEDRKGAWREWKRILKVGGIAGILEIHRPQRSWYQMGLDAYWQYFIPWAGEHFSERSSYEYLRDTVADFLRPDELCEELSQFGFRAIVSESIIFDGLVNMLVVKRDA